MDSSVVNEFNLYCERERYKQDSTTLFMLGTGLGAVLMQSVADFVGRLRCALLFTVIISTINFAMSYSPNFIIWLETVLLTPIYYVLYNRLIDKKVLLTKRGKVLPADP